MRENGADLDDIDVRIMDLLRHDGRLPSSQVARELKIPEATARYRIKRLKTRGFLISMAMPNLDQLQRRILVVFFVRTHPGKTLELAEQLKHMEAVRYLAIGSGHYDLFISTAFATEDEYLEFRHAILGASDAVESFQPMQLIKTLSRLYDFTLPEGIDFSGQGRVVSNSDGESG
jgi:Lrp/AsnC family transcriptional regulator for asnA, asnC and gidA